jgi:hypothetical protein
MWPPAQARQSERHAKGVKTDCESLPCPCLKPGDGPGGGGGGTPPEDSGPSCTKPTAVQRLVFSASKYPNIRKHVRAAIKKGWPSVLVLNRPDADARRDRLMEEMQEEFPARDNFDRDEYPPAVGRGKGKGLQRGTDPRGWKADLRYVPRSENRSHGASLGAKLDDFCNGTRFRYVFQ